MLIYTILLLLSTPYKMNPILVYCQTNVITALFGEDITSLRLVCYLLSVNINKLHFEI